MFAEAVPHLQHVVTIAPNNRDARLSLAVALQKSGQDEASIPHYEQILAVDPANRRAMVGLAQALLQREEPEERAAELWEKLVESNPDNPAYLNNLATVRKGLKQYEASEEVSRRALGLSANYLPALCNLGIALSCQGRFEEARELFEKALEIAEAPRQAPSADAQDSDRKDRPKLFFNDELPEKTWRELQVVARSQSATLANTFGDLEAVHRHLDHALALDPDDVDCHMMRGFAHLATGEYEPGFREYEWRRKSKHKPRVFPKPEWKGELAPDSRLLIHAEQGLGDAIHFIRYARIAQQRVGQVYFLVHRPIVKLMQSSSYVNQVIGEGDALPEYDLHIPLMSLPGVCGTTLDNVPNEVPYLAIDRQLVDDWRGKLAHLEGLRVGICWQGNREFGNDQYRSVELARFSALAMPSIQFISLQKGDGAEQIDNAGFSVRQFSGIDTEPGGAFLDTAAIMLNLDLVISTDTAIPHLAGALGVPVWLATSFNCEWRWMLRGERSPWYPSMTLFRQAQLGDWDSVFAAMATRLKQGKAAFTPS
ncbi:MAG: tetratricopeptide repeat protein [Planctomycetales bacterium]|nr:tetratricopeptide repeat protein [Planctomycetales bacterium]